MMNDFIETVDTAKYLTRDGKRVYICQPDFQEIESNYGREGIVRIVSRCITENGLTIEDARGGIDGDDVQRDFRELCNLDGNSLWKEGETYCKYSGAKYLNGEYIARSSVGGKSSNYFHWDDRMRVEATGKGSIVSAWEDSDKHPKWLKLLWALKYDNVDSNKLLACLRLGWSEATQFRPSVAKAVYERYGGSNARILDMSSGWGDRLAGFYGSKNTKMYLGIDPNSSLFESYQKQRKMYSGALKAMSDSYEPRGFVCNKVSKMMEACSERIDYGNLKFDVAFTSPPYYVKERYNASADQSWIEYDTFEQWLEEFYFVSLEKAYNSLVSGGHLIINITDIRDGSEFFNICDPMVDYMSTLKGSTFMGAAGMELGLRPFTGISKDVVYVEPIFVWKKDV